jgi:acetyl/propionyl-CoA carboxylase alpha subunit
MAVALSETRAEPPRNQKGERTGGLRTNLEFLRRLAVHPRVLAGDTTTHLIADHPELTEEAGQIAGVESADLVVAAAIFEAGLQYGAMPSRSEWAQTAVREGLR